MREIRKKQWVGVREREREKGQEGRKRGYRKCTAGRREKPTDIRVRTYLTYLGRYLLTLYAVRTTAC